MLHDRREDVEAAQQSIFAAIEQRQYDPTSRFAIRIAFEEALINAFKHGNHNNPAKTVAIDCLVDDRQIVLRIEDQGEGFAVTAVPDPTQEENLEIPSGRGIVLMRSFMTSVEFNERGNCVRMVYEKPDARSETA